MSGLSDFLEKAKADGAHKNNPWAIATLDGNEHGGAVVQILDNGIILEGKVNATSGNPAGQATQTFIAWDAIASVHRLK